MTLTVSEWLFWLCFLVVFYAYAGYGILLYLLVILKRMIFGRDKNTSDIQHIDANTLPEVTFLVAAYNEKHFINDKLQNSFQFDYPRHKIHYFFVTDGSNDGTPDASRNYPTPSDVQLHVFHQPERRGKIAAVDRIMTFVKTPILISTDANTMVNRDAIKNIVRHFFDAKVGAVAGEKRIALSEEEAAAGAGEGIYWKYESALKRLDSELYSVVGAAGELFAIRTALYEPVKPDTLIEDFYMTMRIAQRGYRVVYEPEAFAVEGYSASVGEELKRKIRIAAGAIQATVRLAPLLNIFKYGTLSFQYISHRVLRWTAAPISLPIIFFTNIYLALQGSRFYQIILLCQVLFYVMAAVGYWLELSKTKVKAFFVPYYFCVMNYAMYKGFFRYVKGNQSVVWEKAKRVNEA
jgi:cellulose synthase/poly-beta-1,6-N-acetylglucosamine synthase-like glycosyltransferase